MYNVLLKAALQENLLVLHILEPWQYFELVLMKEMADTLSKYFASLVSCNFWQ
jgi:hypothetical protein